MAPDEKDRQDTRGASPTWRFAAVTFGAVVVFEALLSVPVVLHRLGELRGHVPFELPLGLSTWGDNKVLLVRAAAIGVGLVVVLLWVHMLRLPGLLRRSMLLVLSLGVLGATEVWLDVLRWRAEAPPLWNQLQRLLIVAAPQLPDGSAVTKASLLSHPNGSVERLHRRLTTWYLADSTLIAQTWPMLDPPSRRTAYLMSAVSAVWVYGNKLAPERTGCVTINEGNGYQPVAASSLTLDEYLAVSIGCCTDYANLLKWLLDVEGVPNRLVLIHGHVFNEAALGMPRRWITLDPTINVLYDASWKDVMRESAAVRVVTFPLPSGRPGPEHRPLATRFRLYMLQGAAAGAFRAFRYQGYGRGVGDPPVGS